MKISNKPVNQAIAHFRKTDQKPQSLWDHLVETGELSGRFADKIGLREAGEILGILHDMGKASKEFQDYIGSATGIIDPDEDAYVAVNEIRGRIDHSSAGAQWLYKIFCKKGKEGEIAAQIMALCIASHHSGLIDCLSPQGRNNFKDRMDKCEEQTHVDEALDKFSKSEKAKLNEMLSKDVEKQIIKKMKSFRENTDSEETCAFKYGLFIRYLFSCLIDADRLSTANFENPSDKQLRNEQYHPWKILIQRMEKKVKEFKDKKDKNEVDELRNQVSQACLDFSTHPKGIYQLTVPTGGGKTLASLRFALHHAACHNMERIFYIIPYTSIIDQNADEVRKILEDRDEKGQYSFRVVLEHHSNLTPEEETHRQNLMAQNWDAPIVFTTQVQFFETLFGYGTRGARRMHQLANSVIIFDEVQTIPIRCIQMFNIALRFLVHDCGSTVVLCTATQPLLDKVEPVQRALTITTKQHIISDESYLSKKLKRVQVFDVRKAGGWNINEVAELAEKELQEKGSVLVVVNTKKSARSLYQLIAPRKLAPTFHLSTNMCPAHRLYVLEDEVKIRLSQNLPVVCISTQLVEAGIDIDFGTVIRYLAGLDSIAQAAGRCNRNGERGSGNVYVVNPEPENENLDNLKDIRDGADNAQRILDEIKENPEIDAIGLESMERYYQYYFYQKQSDMCYRVGRNSPVGQEDNLFNLLSLNKLSAIEYQRINGTSPTLPFKQSFQTAAAAFHTIDAATRGVITPYGMEGKEIVAQLGSVPEIEKNKLLKKAQRYSINLFPYEFEELANKQAIWQIQKDSGIYCLDEQYYSNEYGWNDEIVSEMQTLIY